MTTSLVISGAIDRAQPDPTSPHDPTSTWLGMVTVAWQGGERRAAIVKVATGRGTGDQLWGQHVLLLRWIGDPPPAEVAQAVYDLIRDGGPEERTLRGALLAQPGTETQPSYRMARA